MENFFAVGLEHGDALGFSHYSGGHVFFLVLSAAVIAALCLVCRKLGNKGRRRLRLCIGIAVLCLELAREINLIAGGAFGINYLPLHLCSLAVFFSFFHSLFPNETTGNFLYSLCMPGALCALLFPDWTAYPVFCLHSIIGFASHTLLVAYPLMCVISGMITPCVKHLPRCAGILGLLALPVYAFDRAFDMNYMFLLRPAAGTPLEWFAVLFGDGLYVLGYIPMIVLAWSLLYFPFRVRAARRERAYLPPLS